MLALLEELLNHHKELYEKVKDEEYEQGIAILAAEVNIVLDDYYTAEDLERIHGLILERLQKRREIIVLN
jgi:hypothetical protein